MSKITTLTAQLSGGVLVHDGYASGEDALFIVRARGSSLEPVSMFLDKKEAAQWAAVLKGWAES